ncbi:LysO family transporter [Proteiniborus sp. MB09-C3]|uniref:LysO family transporter n=1 Tax=Proteiniborus sp. MB09-C3 TaxID=3050072 RepID=UPI002556E750|nr:LysO family transporter [Proteiniborus sp. MB09-C3]WIV13409.1 LysO family transporter [Proteiniborus sp. MB09-C3]
MNVRLLLYLGILIIGGFFGYKDYGGKRLDSKLGTIQTICLLFLLFIMGLRMGLDEKVISSFFELGFQALVISIFTITFSVLLVKLVKGFVLKNIHQGEQKNEL